MKNLQTLIDRPDTTKIRTFDRMVAELSPFMTELEVDRTVEFMNTITDSQWDINPSVEDSATQLRIILGSERYFQLKQEWSRRNQRLVPEGRTRYRRRSDGTWWDGLDPEDNPDDYERIVV